MSEQDKRVIEANRRSASTPTERFRSLLDERGIEWWYGTSEKSTVFDGEYGVRYEVDGTLGLLFIRSVLNVTPEQAIAATLGDTVATPTRQGDAWTCHDVHEPPKGTTFWPSPHFKCSECGAVHVSMEYVYFCPNCGRRVVER